MFILKKKKNTLKHLFSSIFIQSGKIWTRAVFLRFPHARISSFINSISQVGERRRSAVPTSWRQSGSVQGPCILSLPVPPPPPLSPPLKSGETHVIREAAEGPVISSHLFCIDHNPLYPSCMVDIIFSSSFLGDMGDHSKSKYSLQTGRCSFKWQIFFLFFFLVFRRSGIMELHDRSSSAPIAHVNS